MKKHYSLNYNINCYYSGENTLKELLEELYLLNIINNKRNDNKKYE